MKFHSSAIFVNDIERAKKFYINVLNQEMEHDFGKNIILKGGLTIWELLPNHIISKSLKTGEDSNRFELYFETESIEEVYKKLKEENVVFLHEVQEEPWGQRTLRFFDPDNHLIEVGESLSVFVKTMYRNGLSIEQIAVKSGIPHETVVFLLQKKPTIRNK